VYALDTGTGRTVAYRAGERFAFASTYKALAAGVVLRRATDGQLDGVVTYGPAELVAYSPVTAQHVGGGMRLSDVMAAALEESDNTAGNLLLDRLGGPAGLQAALRELGDSTTDVDRMEPALNQATPGDRRDTSSPQALATDLRLLVLGDTLTPGRRDLLVGWLAASTTGAAGIRAAVPSGWRVADKTGSGGHGTQNDIAVVWPSGGPPIVVAVLSDRGMASVPSDDALIAGATKAAVAALRSPVA
jgi:beta-lactamase class A